ncbi:MAG TPA: DUF4129 domain-containing protein [Vicinamibacterales bacterium]|jgi:hypothetical protein
MIRPSEVWIATALLIGGALAAAASPPEQNHRPLSVSEYVARLDRLSDAVSGGSDAAARGVPSGQDLSGVVRVEADTRIFDISTASIQRELGAWRLQHDAAARQRLLNDLQFRRSEAERFEQPAAERSRERAILRDVLSAHEFAGLEGPSWSDRLRQRFLQALVRLFSSRPSSIATIGSVIVYGLVALALVVLALASYRFIQRSSRIEIAPPSPANTRLRDWPQWLADAQAMAGQRRWREAIHFTYWCAVAFLEANGAWRPDRARTPREYLRLLSSSTAERESLGALTRDFEEIWYGYATADQAAFEGAVARLRQLGCPAA